MEEQRSTGATTISGRSHLNITLNIFSCGRQIYAAGELFPYFEDDVYTLLVLRGGEGYLRMDGFESPVQKGSVIAALPGHKIALTVVGAGSMEAVWVSFGGYLVDVYLSRGNLYASHPMTGDPDGRALHLLERLCEASRHMPNRYCKMMALLYEVFAVLLDGYPAGRGFEADRNADYYALRAIDRIERDYFHQRKVEELALELGITRKHLCMAFTKTIGITPKKYAILYRIERAGKLLRDTPQSVGEIAEAVGYSDQFHFAKEFKRITGLSPTDYRKGQAVSPALSTEKLKESLIRRLGGGEM